MPRNIKLRHLCTMLALLIVAVLIGVIVTPHLHAAGPVIVVPPAPNLRITNEVRVYHAVKDAVVNIASTRIVNAPVGTGDEVFDRVFGPRFVRPVPMQSLGSGFVIHPAGYIVTNEHVVDRATEVQVVLADGQKLAAQVLATDNEHDLAVLKVTPRADKPLTAITLGASEDLMIGEPVYAIGNPFGYSGTMTRGIVSAMDRELDFGQGKIYKGLVQTDASINPGNSGGPLLNAYGQVVGINTAIRSDARGIGFAIGVSRLRDLLPEFLNTEALHRAVVGFVIEEKRTLSPPATVVTKVLLKSVEANSQAAKAGLQAGDELWTVQGQEVRDIVGTLVALAEVKVGDTVTVRLARGGLAYDTKFVVTQGLPPEGERVVWARLGLAGRDVTPELAAQEKLATNAGVQITSVEKGGPAAAAGLMKGDILVQLGQYYVTSLNDVASLVKSAKPGLPARVGVIRGDTRGRTLITIR